MPRGKQESAGAGREPLRPLKDVAEAKVDTMQSVARRPHGKVDNARESRCIALCAGNRPGNAQRALLLADRCRGIGRRRAVVRLDTRGKAAEHDRLLSVRERKHAIHKTAFAVRDTRAVHNVAGIESPTSGRRVSTRRARRLCGHKRHSTARRPIGFIGSLRLRTN